MYSGERSCKQLKLNHNTDLLEVNSEEEKGEGSLKGQENSSMTKSTGQEEAKEPTLSEIMKAIKSIDERVKKLETKVQRRNLSSTGSKQSLKTMIKKS